MEDKKPAPVEKSLGYIAWDMKCLVKEIQKLISILESFAKSKGDQDVPF